MKRVSQVYVITVNSLDNSATRLWTGTSLHALRRCSTTRIGEMLREIQVELDTHAGPARRAKPGASDYLNRSR